MTGSGRPADAVVALLKSCARLQPASRRRLLDAIDEVTEALSAETRATLTLGQVVDVAAAEDVLQALGLILLDPGSAYSAAHMTEVRPLDSERDSGSAIRGEAE